MLTTRELSSLLATGPVPLDGGLGTTLEQQGVDIADMLWSARAILDHPDQVRRAHERFLAAGAAIIISGSYQVSREGFIAAGLDAATADDALRRSVALAREAVIGAGAPGLVAASVGPFGAISHDGGEFRGDYGLPRKQLRDFHARRIEVLADADPDFLAVETIPDVREVVAAVDALGDLPAWICMSCADGSSTSAKQPIEDAVLAASTAPGVFAVGVNCTAPAYIPELLARIRSVTRLPVVLYPNAGRDWVDGDWVGESTGLQAEDVAHWLSAGAAVVGGCCETAPEDIALVSHMCATRRGSPAPPAASR